MSSSNLLPGGRPPSKIQDYDNAVFKDTMFQNKRTQTTSGFGCKYGGKCTEFNPSEYAKAAKLKSLMTAVSDTVLYGWSEIPKIYRSFIAEHPNYANYASAVELPIKVRNHFKQYAINRVSCSTGNLYNIAYEYFYQATNSKQGSTSNTGVKTMTTVSEKTLSQNTSTVTETSNIASNGRSVSRTVTNMDGGSTTIRHPGWKNTNVCQGLADGYYAKTTGGHTKMNYCNLGGQRGYIAVVSWSKPYYCSKCRCYHCGKSQNDWVDRNCKVKSTSSNSNSSGSTSNNNTSTNTGNSGSSNNTNTNTGSGGTTTNGTTSSGSTIDSNTNTGTFAPPTLTNTTENQDGTKTETYSDGSTKTYDADGNLINETAATTTGAVSSGYIRSNGLYSDPADADEDGTDPYQDRAIIVNTEKWTEDELNDAIQKTGFTDSYGDPMDSTNEIELIPGFPDSDNSNKTRIFGLPMMYNSICDPNGRVFSETTMMDLPLVYIQPGRGVMNQQVSDSDEDALKKIAEDFTSTDAGGGTKFSGSMRDLRTLAFQDAFSEYIDYFQNLATICYNHCGGKGVFKWNKALEMNWKDMSITDGGRSLVFFADTSTSISDSFTNEYTESGLVQTSNDLALKVRELKQLAVRDAASGTLSEITSGQAQNDTNTSSTGVGALLEQTKDKIFGSISRILNGSQLLYPQIWNDSRMDRSYNISFKFFSPYGDKMSIFNNVYLPFIALLTMTLPRMDSISGYAQPFYVRVNSPG